MTNLPRRLDLTALLARKSFFLLGPRSTGKSFLVAQQLTREAMVIDLLRSDMYLKLAAQPMALEAIARAGLQAGAKYIVIDEIQKIPALLDEVHRLIERQHWRFLLTGSSARKLRRGHANLLAGRAWMAQLFPLIRSELQNFDLARYLRYGGLPQVYLSDYPEEELKAYVKTYLYEEIQAEGLIRKIPQFARFLQYAALGNGQLLNFAQLSSDAAVAASTLKEHYAILEDTLIGFCLPPWRRTTKRKAINTAKFYFFDTGVAHALAQTQVLERHTDLYGRSFEHFIILEVRACNSYRRLDDELAFWRSTHQQEVDLIWGEHTAIEIKATQKVTQRDLRGLQALAPESHFKNYFLVSQDPITARHGNILCLHYAEFLQLIWRADFFV